MLLSCVAILAGCGKGDAGERKEEKKDVSGGPAAAPAPAPAPEVTCTEKTDLQVSLSDKEGNGITGAPFEVKAVVGYLGGMVYSGKSLAKLAVVVIANHPNPNVGSYGSVPSPSAGDYDVVLKFSTDTVPVASPAEQKPAWTKLTLQPGSYPPANMGEKQSLGVSVWVGGAGSGPGLSGGASGTATVTQVSPGVICGSIDFTSAKGSTVKGTFNVKLEKVVF
jgi:hypothetical protein